MVIDTFRGTWIDVAEVELSTLTLIDGDGDTFQLNEFPNPWHVRGALELGGLIPPDTPYQPVAHAA